MKFLKQSINKYSLLIILCFSLNLISFSQNISREEKIYGLSKLWSEITYNYPYYEHIPFDFDSLYVDYTTKVINSESDYEYYRLLQRFVCSLHEGHTAVVFPTGISKKIKQFQLWCYRVNNKIYVIRSGSYTNESIINRTNFSDFFSNVEEVDEIPIGSEVLTVNSIPIHNFIDSVIFPYSPVRKEIRYKYLCESMFWYYSKDTIISVGIKRPDGVEKTFLINCVKDVCPRWNKGFNPYPSENKLELLDSNIFYVHFKDFLDYDFLNSFSAKGDSILKTKGLVIDLRHCIGGYNYNPRLLPCFCSDSVFPCVVESRKIEPVKRLQMVNVDNNTNSIYNIKYGSQMETSKNEHFCLYRQDTFPNPMWQIDEQYIYKGKIAILTDEQTASAAEFFILGMKQLTKAVIIGSPTYGSTMSAFKIPLPYGGEGHIMSCRMLNPDGSIFKGIEPDIYFEPTIEEVISGKDAMLEKAIKYILEQNN
ncbi:MAG: hypothetical protein LBV69_07880 [Bacteroidales bacterium]|jgi:hypothetical protein|nr:hypothetical protein [Bacteroidales bacterium]